MKVLECDSKLQETIGSSLVSEGVNTLTHVADSKANFCRFIDDMQWDPGQSVFHQMTNFPIGNEYQDSVVSFRTRLKESTINQVNDSISINIEEFRKIACDVFGGISEAWTYYQTHANKMQAKKAFKASNMPLPPYLDEEAPSSKTQQKAELVSDTSTDPRFVLTDDFDFPVPLCYAIKNQFLNVIQKERWSEALYSTHLSLHGSHGALFETKEGSQYPYLKSSALIQDIPKEWTEKDNTLLTRNRNFRGDNWQLLEKSNKIVTILEEYIKTLNESIRLQVNLSLIPDKPKDNSELEEGVMRALGHNNTTELIRLTGNKSDGFKNSYHGLQHFSELQADISKPFSFGVSYKNLANLFDVLGRLTEEPCYIKMSELQMKECDSITEKKEPITQKILLLNGNLCKAMSDTDWRRAVMLLQKLNRDEDIEPLIQKIRSRTNS